MFNNGIIQEESRLAILKYALRDSVVNNFTGFNEEFKTAKTKESFTWHTKDYIELFRLRLATSGCIVEDPKEAELFIIPFAAHTERSYHGAQRGNICMIMYSGAYC